MQSMDVREGSAGVMESGDAYESLRERINTLPEGNHTIAIDGRSAAGKTSLALKLAECMDANVVHMDDFFLPGELRTKERFAQPGGNVHYERFMEEVLPFLNRGEAFSYVPFDCGCMELKGCRELKPARFTIVEGAYSCHPILGNYMSLKVFMDVDSDVQMTRICGRNGVKQAEMFQKRWIPLEENYFKTFSIREKADIVLRNE